MKYQKLPIIVDAEQFFPDVMPWPEGVVGIDPDRPEPVVKPNEAMSWGIQTLEGWHLVAPGDWIVTGIAGERYPVKPHIFAKTYVEYSVVEAERQRFDDARHG